MTEKNDNAVQIFFSIYIFNSQFQKYGSIVLLSIVNIGGATLASSPMVPPYYGKLVKL